MAGTAKNGGTTLRASAGGTGGVRSRQGPRAGTRQTRAGRAGYERGWMTIVIGPGPTGITASANASHGSAVGAASATSLEPAACAGVIGHALHGGQAGGGVATGGVTTGGVTTGAGVGVL